MIIIYLGNVCNAQNNFVAVNMGVVLIKKLWCCPLVVAGLPVESALVTWPGIWISNIRGRYTQGIHSSCRLGRVRWRRGCWVPALGRCCWVLDINVLLFFPERTFSGRQKILIFSIIFELGIFPKIHFLSKFSKISWLDLRARQFERNAGVGPLISKWWTSRELVACRECREDRWTTFDA